MPPRSLGLLANFLSLSGEKFRSLLGVIARLSAQAASPPVAQRLPLGSMWVPFYAR